MTIGYFDDNANEYVITEPNTPYPWINYLGNEAFYSLLSNTAGGYSFYKDAKFRRLTRFRYNNVPVDSGGKYFYINDGGTLWSPSWKPMKTPLDRYECRHGMGYSTIEGELNQLACSVQFFVPLGENVEVQKLKLENKSGDTKRISLFSFVEWCLWNAEDDMTNFQRNFSTGEVEVDRSDTGCAIYHKTEYRERRNHFAFYAVNAPVAGFDTCRDAFLGRGNGFNEAAVPSDGSASNSIAHGWSPVASHALSIELAPNESKELVFVLGYQENDEDKKWQQPGIVNKEHAKATIARFATSEHADKALIELKNYWSDRLSRYQVHSNDERLNRMVNTWNPYQCMVTFNFSRSASYFESGIGRGMGFRDSNQDLIGMLHMEPKRARERILDIAATQMPDGSAYHQYQPLTKRGNAAIGGNFNDDPLWLIQSVTAYIKETGDFGILDESVPFDNDESNSASLIAHLKASFDHVINNLGPHGLPLIGRADWNDCLNLNCFSTDPNESFQTTENQQSSIAESVMIAGMFVYFGQEYAALCKRIDWQDEVKRAEAHIDLMRSAVAEHAWDGRWFLRAYDANGNKVGSDKNSEGKIFIEPQGFCVMAGLGMEDGRAEKALDSVAEHLACEHGVVLVSPAFKKYHIELGEISTYPPGYKENGGIFCHNNPWIMIAETKLRRADKAFDYYKRISPAYQDQKIDLHKTEPYVYAQMIAGKESAAPGEAKNSWLTGTAAWNYHTVTEHLLGIKPDYDGLLVEPCLPKEVSVETIRRVFREAEFTFSFEEATKDVAVVSALTVNGKKIEGNYLKAPFDEAKYEVVVHFEK